MPELSLLNAAALVVAVVAYIITPRLFAWQESAQTEITASMRALVLPLVMIALMGVMAAFITEPNDPRLVAAAVGMSISFLVQEFRRELAEHRRSRQALAALGQVRDELE